MLHDGLELLNLTYDDTSSSILGVSNTNMAGLHMKFGVGAPSLICYSWVIENGWSDRDPARPAWNQDAHVTHTRLSESQTHSSTFPRFPCCRSFSVART